MKISTAQLDWQNVDGIDIPVSQQFGDVYFSKANGLLETRHVFLQGNDLAERLAQLDDFQYFCVGETGFGTGLNILALWQLWQQVRPQNHSHLHVVSVEKYPLSHADLKRALAVWHELADLSEQLLQVYPLPIAGCHRLEFPQERLSIDLWLGDAADVLPQIKSKHPIDAWFLDGFAPACNPDFWQEHILQHIIRLSAVGTTFASFTVAGVVKRGLAKYGIHIRRPKGFGHKREMLKACWQADDTTLPTVKAPKKQQNIAIIGAGIAGLQCASHLAQRGHHVHIFEQQHAVAGASGNPLALLNPKLCPIEQTSSHLMVSSWLYALRHYQKYQAFQALNIAQLQLKADHEAEQYHQHYPAHCVSAVQQDDEKAFPYIDLHHAGAIQPQLLAQEILSQANIHFHQAQVVKISTQHNGLVQLDFAQGESQFFDAVVICTARHSAMLAADLPALKPIRGQVSWCDRQIFAHQQAYSYGGYAVQLAQQLLLGASFYPHRADDDVLLEDHQHNFDLFAKSFPQLASQLPPIDTWQGRASVRAQSADYFPLVGQVGEQAIFTLTGLGSKGFLFAPLCAEMVAAEILHEVYPVPDALYHKLKVQRFKKKV